MTYRAPGLNKARVARNARAYRARRRAASCSECSIPLDQVADCTCMVTPAAKPLRRRRVKGQP